MVASCLLNTLHRYFAFHYLQNILWKFCTLTPESTTKNTASFYGKAIIPCVNFVSWILFSTQLTMRFYAETSTIAELCNASASVGSIQKLGRQLFIWLTSFLGCFVIVVNRKKKYIKLFL